MSSRVDASTTQQLKGRAGPSPVPGTMRLADGTVLAVLDEGRRDAAVTVVLVAGWTQDHTSWDDVIARLRATRPDLRVVAPDARGHGWSDAGPRGHNTVDQLADDLAELITEFVPTGEVVVAGHSLGGPVIMALAERHPALVRDRVRGVGLVATSAAHLGTDLFGLSARLTAPAMALTPLVTRVRGWSRARVNLHHPSLIAWAIHQGFYGPGADSPRNRRRTAAQTSRAHPATSAQLVDEMLHHDRRHVLGALDQVPAVVFAGTKDGLCPMAHSRAMVAEMPHAQFVVFEKAGHMLPYERAVEVAEGLAGLAG